MTTIRSGETGPQIPIKRWMPEPPPIIPRETEDPLRRATMQCESAYLKPYANQKLLHQDASSMRSIEFNNLASDGRKFADKLQQLASGFAQVSLLDDGQGWSPFKSGFPKDLPIDDPTRDLLLDIACMRVWFDKWAVGNPAINLAIKSELQEVLKEFGLIPSNPSEEPSEKGALNNEFKSSERSFQETISFLLSSNIRLTPKPAPDLNS